MARVINFEGRTISLPDDATDAEVAIALEGAVPQSSVNAQANARLQRQGATYTAPDTSQPTESSVTPNISHGYRNPQTTREASREFLSGMSGLRGALNIGDSIVGKLFNLGGDKVSERSLSDLVTGNAPKHFGDKVIGPETDKYPGVAALGSFFDPTTWAAGLGAGKAVSMVKPITNLTSKAIPRVVESLARSGAEGAIAGGTSAYLGSDGDLSTAGTGAALGGAAGVAVPTVLKIGAKGAGYLTDLATGKVGDIKAGRIISEAVGPEIFLLLRLHGLLIPREVLRLKW